VLVLVVVLDLWDFGAKKRPRSFGNYFVPSEVFGLMGIIEVDQDRHFLARLRIKYRPEKVRLNGGNKSGTVRPL
jgi:hypothetical protein